MIILVGWWLAGWLFACLLVRLFGNWFVVGCVIILVVCWLTGWLVVRLFSCWLVGWVIIWFGVVSRLAGWLFVCLLV